MNTNTVTSARERVVRVQNGWIMLVLLIAALLADAALLVYAIKDGVETEGHPHGGLLAAGIIALPIIVILMTGFFRSEGRPVGEECRCRRSPYHLKKKK